MEIKNDIMDELREAAEAMLTVVSALSSALLLMPPGVGPGKSRGEPANILSTACLALERINENLESAISELESQKQPAEN